MIELDPSRHGAYYERGLAYIAQGERELPLADFDQALSLAADDPVWVRFYEEARCHSFDIGCE